MSEVTPVNPHLNATAAARMSPADYEKHRQEELGRRGEFAKHYPTIATAIDNQIKASLPSDVDAREVIIPVQGRNEEEDEKLAEVRKVHRRMAEAGTIPATVINLLPWDVQATGVHLMYDDMRIPRCPIGMAFAKKTIVSYKVDLEDKGGRFGADVMTPIALAADIVRQLQPQKRGGLFYYMGDHNPGEHPPAREKEMAVWDRARKDMVRYFRQLYREAEGFYQQSSRRGLMNIVDSHRMACQWLLHYRFITQVPAWLTATREEGDVPDACPSCGAEAGGGYSCGECGYIFDPARAYEMGEIDDDHQALRRLSREQLDALGLEYVMTKDEYRAARRKLATEEVEEDGGDATETETSGISRPSRRRSKKRAAARKAAKPQTETAPAEDDKG